MESLEREAAVYEGLSILFNDRTKAYQVFKALKINGKEPLPSYSYELINNYGLTQDLIDSVWLSVRGSFEDSRIKYNVLKRDSLEEEEELVPFIYLAGDSSLLSSKKITLIGAPTPSLFSKEKSAEIVHEIVKSGGSVIAPLELGLSAFCLSRALKEGGKAIGVLSTPLTKVSNENLLELQMNLYENGLLLTQFAPSSKKEKVNVVYRNRFLSSISETVLIIEEKDGGPSWPIFDSALKRGKNCLIEKNLAENPNSRFSINRLEEGASILKKSKDISKYLSKKQPIKKKIENVDTPDLFGGALEFNS